MFLDKQIKEKVKEAIASLYGQSIDQKLIQVEKTNKDYTGDWTVVVFPFLRISRKSPEITANEIVFARKAHFLRYACKKIVYFDRLNTSHLPQ